MIRVVSVVLVLALGVSLTLTGCGGDGGSAAPVASNVSSSAPPAPPGPPGPPSAPAAPTPPPSSEGMNPGSPGSPPGERGSGSSTDPMAAQYDPMNNPGGVPAPGPGSSPGSTGDPVTADPNYNIPSNTTGPDGTQSFTPDTANPTPYNPGSERAGSNAPGPDGTYPPGSMPEGSYPPGAMPGQPGQPKGPVMRGPFGMVSSMLDGVSGVWKLAEVKAAEKQLPTAARVAFMAGDDREAARQVLAGYLVNESAAAALPNHMHWYGGLMRPAVMVRTGIGVVYTPPNGFTGNPYAVGPRVEAAAGPGGESAEMNTIRRGQQGGGQQPQGPPPPAASDPGADARSNLNYYAGDLGMQVVAGIESRIRSGSFGGALRAALLPSKIPGLPGGVPPGAAGYPPGSSPEGYPAMAPGMNPGGYPGSMPGDAAAKLGGAKSFMPGLSWLGVADAADLAKQAKEQELDLLIVFEVTIRQARGVEFVQNTTKFRAIIVPTNQVIFSSAQINNLKIYEERNKSKTDDSIGDEAKRFFTAADKVLTPASLPAGVTADRALARSKDLAAKKPANPLQTLVEIRFYNKLGLIADNDVTEAFVTLLGDEKAEELLKTSSSMEERAMSLTDWIQPPVPTGLPKMIR